jgi:drug/metabolite transporter (DMT)-like permease
MVNKPRKEGIPSKGVSAALSSAFFLGMAPIFGKAAISNGTPPLAAVALRTLFAAVLLLLVLLFFRRKFFYIYPAGLLGCLLAGGINGLGSLFYYSALGRVDAGLGHLLYLLYPLFVALWMWFDHQPPTRLTALRLALILPGLFFLTRANHYTIDLVGVLQMLAAAALYALHLPINQRVLYDMPAPTVTFYTLVSMSIVVVPAYLLSTSFSPFGNLVSLPTAAWWAMGGLTLVTFLSRLTLFTGVKHLGGMQTALLGLGELLVALSSAFLFLGESFTRQQWFGATLIILSLGLVGIERSYVQKKSRGGWLSWINPTQVPVDLTWHSPD